MVQGFRVEGALLRIFGFRVQVRGCWGLSSGGQHLHYRVSSVSCLQGWGEAQTKVGSKIAYQLLCACCVHGGVCICSVQGCGAQPILS